MKLKELFKQDEVTDVKTVAEFLARYYKPERYTGRTKATGWDDNYAADLLAHYQGDFDKNGYTFISHHDSVTGRVVSFYGRQA